MDGVMGALQRGLSFPFMVFRGCVTGCAAMGFVLSPEGQKGDGKGDWTGCVRGGSLALLCKWGQQKRGKPFGFK